MTENIKAGFLINGGNPLYGSVKVSGAKNSATKLLVASLLTNEKCLLHNSPNKIADLTITSRICQKLGSNVEIDNDTLITSTPHVVSSHVPFELGNLNRIAILLAGPLLHRTGKAEIPIPGGCRIGNRPVNFHIEALEKLGCTVTEQGEYYYIEADQLKGANINLPYPSVGATENIIISSCLAKGRTILTNAAIEPEIIDLIKFLQKMGAIIEISTDRRITIEGVEKLYSVEHSVIPDRNQAASFACAGIASKGDVFIENAIQDDLITFLNSIRRIGGNYEVKDNGIRFYYTDELKSIAVETNVHPGFMTDWQQPFVIMMTQARGVSIFHETVYEDRFGYIKALKQMGADIELYNSCLGGGHCRFANSNYYHSAVVKGAVKLHSAEIEVPDLRAGFSYLIAGVIASGESHIKGAYYIDRGYEQIDEKLRHLGADIKRTNY
ncbi:MAG: UDP-N-acetylglucosamine 1-carboxyvinyltransferase [Chlorobi bacterium OLB4]|nr:MAG: UDP-N-acetylglucosamine 1-carboxyvinyltransferase [Chlorobi bacterium OLB4]